MGANESWLHMGQLLPPCALWCQLRSSTCLHKRALPPPHHHHHHTPISPYAPVCLRRVLCLVPLLSVWGVLVVCAA